MSDKVSIKLCQEYEQNMTAGNLISSVSIFRITVSKVESHHKQVKVKVLNKSSKTKSYKNINNLSSAGT